MKCSICKADMVHGPDDNPVFIRHPSLPGKVWIAKLCRVCYAAFAKDPQGNQKKIIRAIKAGEI